MKNITPIIFSLNLLLMLFGSSCKERPCPEYLVRVDTAYISHKGKEHLESYHGFDTLKFLTEKGDTITFLGQGLNSGYKQRDNYAEDYCSTKRTTYKQFEGYSFYPLSNYPSEIQYYVSRDLNSEWGVDFYIIINKVAFYTSPYLPSSGNSIYINGLIINGNTYNNVYKIYRNYDPEDKYYIYYNKLDGILQVVFPSGETLSKIK